MDSGDMNQRKEKEKERTILFILINLNDCGDLNRKLP